MERYVSTHILLVRVPVRVLVSVRILIPMPVPVPVCRNPLSEHPWCRLRKMLKALLAAGKDRMMNPEDARKSAIIDQLINDFKNQAALADRLARGIPVAPLQQCAHPARRRPVCPGRHRHHSRALGHDRSRDCGRARAAGRLQHRLITSLLAEGA